MQENYVHHPHCVSAAAAILHILTFRSVKTGGLEGSVDANAGTALQNMQDTAHAVKQDTCTSGEEPVMP